jgi:hypothetical protein
MDLARAIWSSLWLWHDEIQVMDKTIAGGCFCRRVRYSATGDPLVRAMCHCRSCRHAAGGPSVAWVTFPRQAVGISGGEPAIYSSSPGVEWMFCGGCGTLLAYRRDTRPDEIDLTTASLDAPDDLGPTIEIWTEDKISWVRLHEDLPHRRRVTE